MTFSVPTRARINSTCSVQDLARRPVRRNPGDLVQEPAQHLLTMLGMQHLRVVLHTGQPALHVLEGRDRRVRGGRRDGEARRRFGHRVTMAHPHPDPGRKPLQQGRTRISDGEFSGPVLATTGPVDPAAERRGHGLESVADPQDRDVGVEQRRVELRRVRAVDAGRTAGQDDRRGRLGQHVGHRHGRRHDLRIHGGFPHPPGDELRVLRAEINDQDGVRLQLMPGKVARAWWHGRG